MARVAQIGAKTSEAPQAILLAVGSLVAPHKKHGRLSIRVERLPQGSRLTRGTRNNDGSWSLQSDELEDLGYVPPDGFDKAHTLVLRIIGLQTGATLALADLPVTPGAGLLEVRAPAPIAPGTDGADLRMLREELAKAKEALSARDAELTERLVSASAEAAQQFKATLAKAEAAWTAGEAARLAAAEAQWQEDFAQALADARAEAAGAGAEVLQAERQEWQEKFAALEATVAERDAELARAVELGDAARERGQSEAHGARAKLAALEATLAEREAALAQAKRDADAANTAAARDAASALDRAEQAWKDAEAVRLAAAEARWREASAKALADARADAAATQTQGHSETERALLEQLTQLQAAIGERNAALARARAASEEARAQATADAEERIGRVEHTLKAAETSRVAALEADWQARLAKAVADARAEVPAVPVEPSWNNGELDALREKLKSAQKKLSERDGALSRMRQSMDEERRRWQKDAQDAIAKAARDRKGDDAKKVAAAQADLRKESARELALITARAEAAEAALAHVRMRASDDTRLHTELSSARAALAAKEAELAWERERRLAEHPVEPVEPVPAKKVRKDAEEATAGSTMFRDTVIAACVGVVGVIFWPDISALIWGPPAPVAKPKVAAVAAIEAPAPVLPHAVVAKSAKLRADSKPNAAVVGKLATGTDVAILEERDGWSHVRFGAAGEAPQEGWVKSSTLKADAAGTTTPIRH